jgi:hypothetical protein
MIVEYSDRKRDPGIRDANPPVDRYAHSKLTAEASLNMRRDTIKAVFLATALLTGLYCNHRADSFDRQARSLSEQIASIRRFYIEDASGSAAVDRVVEPLEATRLALVQKSQELNHLFIYVISSFLGLAVSVAADLLGQHFPTNSKPSEPTDLK